MAEDKGTTQLAERPAPPVHSAGESTITSAATSSTAASSATMSAATSSTPASSTAMSVKTSSTSSAMASATPSTAAAKVSAAAGTKAIPVAAVSFVSGLVGLLVANLLLGPLAIILGLVGLRTDSGRRTRATLGILLGVADIAVFFLLALHSGAHQGSLSWNFLNR